MHIRTASMDDLDAINGILISVIEEFRAKGITMWQNGYPDKTNIAADISTGNAYVAAKDDKILGYMYIHYGPEEFHKTLLGEWKDTNCTVMHRLLTDQSARGTGIGSALMDFWEENSRETGCTSMRTETDETNKPMRSLMRKCGFEEKGVLRFDNSDKLGFEKLIVG